MKLSYLIRIFPLILLFLFCCNSSFSLYSSSDEVIVGFQITDFPWPPLREVSDYIPITCFTFPILYEVWNPYSQSIEIHTPNYNLINVSGYFQPLNNSFSLNIPRGVYPSPNTFLFEPGLTTTFTDLIISVNSTDLVTLPFGYYTFWIDLDFSYEGYYKVVSFSTYVNRTFEETIISQEHTPPTWGKTIYTVDITYDSVSSTSMTLIIVLLSFISLAYLSKQEIYP